MRHCVFMQRAGWAKAKKSALVYRVRPEWMESLLWILSWLAKGCFFMCGIVGYIGAQDAKALLLEGLERLEYRGYDRVGIALMDDRANVSIEKTTRKVAALRKNTMAMADTVQGIGHTR